MHLPKIWFYRKEINERRNWFQAELNEMISNKKLAELEYKIDFHAQLLQWIKSFQLRNDQSENEIHRVLLVKCGFKVKIKSRL